MSGSVKPFNLYMAGNIMLDNDQLFKNIVGLCASKFEAELCHLLQSHIKVKGISESEWKSLNEDCNEQFIKSWLSINDNKNAYSLVLIERQLFFALMETAYGGDITTASPDFSKRKNTSVDWRFHRQITEFLLTNLGDAMSAVAPFRIELLKDAREATHAERIHDKRYGHVVTDVFKVEVAGVSGVIKIEYPAVLLKRAMGQISTGSTRKARLDELKDSLISVPLPVIGTIPMTSLSMNDVVNLKEGDFLSLPPTTNAEVSIGGIPFFNAELTERRGRLTLELGQSVRHEDNVPRS